MYKIDENSMTKLKLKIRAPGRGFEPRSPEGHGLSRDKRVIKVLNAIKDQPLKPKDIMTSTGIPRRSLFRILDNLASKGLIKAENGYYRITDKGLRFLENNTFDCHDIKAIFKVSRINTTKVVELCKKSVDMDGWKAYYVNLEPYAPATAQINVAKEKTILLHIKRFKVINDEDAQIKAYNILDECKKALCFLEIVPNPFCLELIDIKPKSIFGHYAMRLPDDFPVENNYEEVRFGRPATDLQGKQLDFEAKAWVDKSMGPPEMETNDMTLFKRICYHIDKLPQELEHLKTLLLNVNGTLNRLEQVVKEFNEFVQKFTNLLEEYKEFKRLESETYVKFLKANEALALNIQTHIPYMQKADAFLEKAIKILDYNEESQRRQYETFNKTVSELKDLIIHLYKKLEEKDQISKNKRRNGRSKSNSSSEVDLSKLPHGLGVLIKWQKSLDEKMKKRRLSG